MTHELFAALRAMPLKEAEKAFDASVCSNPKAWLTDRSLLIRSEMIRDTELGARLARKTNRIVGKSDVAPEMIDVVFGDQIEAGCRRIRPVAKGVAVDPPIRELVVRFAGPLPGPALDIDARYLRLADALLDGIDAFTASGYFSPVLLWKGNAIAGAIMPIYWRLPPMSDVGVGPDLLMPAPNGLEWTPDWSPLRSVVADRKTMLEAIVRLLGGAPSKARGYGWAVPTRAGVLRLGLASDGTLDARFDEPARAWIFAGARTPSSETDPSHGTGELPLPDDDPADWRHRSLLHALGRLRLPLAPQDRPPPALLTGFPAPLFQPRYQILERVEGWAVLDLERGQFLRGFSRVNPNEGVVGGQVVDAWAARNKRTVARFHAAETARRLNAAFRLSEGPPR